MLWLGRGLGKLPPRANIHKAHIIEDVVAGHLKSLSFTDPREVGARLRDALSVFFLHVGQKEVFEHILAGIDTALWDLALRSMGQSFATFMGVKPQANTYATSINVEDLDQLIPKHAALGQKYFKLKIGFAEHGHSEIVDRAASLCRAGGQIMVDSNQSWTLSEAKHALASIEDHAPFFAEEALRADAPLSDWETLASSTSIPLAGGENIYGIDRFLTMTRAGMRVLQPDVAKWGGVSGALDLAKSAPEDCLIWPHFMGTAVGQMAALSVTAAIDHTACCEVDVNENALRDALCGAAIEIKNGQVALCSQPGLVVPPAPSSLEKFSDVIR